MKKEEKEGLIGLAVLFFIFFPIIGWLCNDTTTMKTSILELYLGEIVLVGIVYGLFHLFAKIV